MLSTISKKRVIEALEKSGSISIVSVNDKGQCTEITSKINDKPIFFYILPGRFSESLVIRISPVPLGCLEAIYSPNALYTIYWGYSVEELARSLETKARATISIYTSTSQ